MSTAKGEQILYVLVDGENMDRTLSNILGRPPMGDDRPRWDNVLRFSEGLWGGRTTKSLFFINVRPEAPIPGSFVFAIKQIGYHPVPLTGDEQRSGIDVGIVRTLDALAQREGDILLLSHNKEFCEQLHKLNDGKRHLGVLAFEEHLPGAYYEIEGLDVLDIEHDARAFLGGPLPRILPTPIDEFNPEKLLDIVDRRS